MRRSFSFALDWRWLRSRRTAYGALPSNTPYKNRSHTGRTSQLAVHGVLFIHGVHLAHLPHVAFLYPGFIVNTCIAHAMHFPIRALHLAREVEPRAYDRVIALLLHAHDMKLGAKILHRIELGLKLIHVGLVRHDTPVRAGHFPIV